MNIKYFADTDTALLEFSARPVEETREINSNIYIDLDAEGHLVAMTIEHASEHTDLSVVSLANLAGAAR